MKVGIVCAHCRADALKEAGGVNRSRRAGLPLYCSRNCAGLAHRKHKTTEQKIAEKAVYDVEYRERNAALLKAKKAAYYAATVDREKERRVRRARMPQHVEYCRRPEYRKWKADYDKKFNARKGYGDFSEVAIVLNELSAEILSRATRYEIDCANAVINKKLNRRRDYDRQTISR